MSGWHKGVHKLVEQLTMFSQCIPQRYVCYCESLQAALVFGGLVAFIGAWPLVLMVNGQPEEYCHSSGQNFLKVFWHHC